MIRMTDSMLRLRFPTPSGMQNGRRGLFPFADPYLHRRSLLWALGPTIRIAPSRSPVPPSISTNGSNLVWVPLTGRYSNSSDSKSDHFTALTRHLSQV